MKRSEVIKYLILRTVGNFLVLFTIFGFLFTFGPTVYYEINYRIEKAQGVKYIVAETLEIDKLEESDNQIPSDIPIPNNNGDESLLENVSTNPNEKILIPPSTDFSIIIPKIGASQKVFPNVDPSNTNEFLPILQKGVAHAKGSAFPGMNGTTYVFAHSTDSFWNVGRYNAVFFLLKEMEEKDEVIVFFNNKRYNYEVFDKKIVDATDTSYLNSNLGQGEVLILQTCWPPGTTWKRLFVFAKPKVN